MVVQTVQTTFLSAGPRFRLDLPTDFFPRPKLSSPLNVHTTWGARSFDFIPWEIDGGMVEDPLIETRTDRDGRLVEVHKQADPPPDVWWLRWPLQKGVLYTHLREEDGLEFADTVLRSLSILEEGPDADVFLLPEPPLRSAIAAQPGFDEAASFWSSEGRPWSLTLRRPGFVADGQTLIARNLDPPVLRAGTDFGIELAVVATDVSEGRSLLDAALASLNEV